MTRSIVYNPRKRSGHLVHAGMSHNLALVQAYERGTEGVEKYETGPWINLVLAYWRCGRREDARKISDRVPPPRCRSHSQCNPASDTLQDVVLSDYTGCLRGGRVGHGL